jgi:hypothetical protein
MSAPSVKFVKKPNCTKARSVIPEILNRVEPEVSYTEATLSNKDTLMQLSNIRALPNESHGKTECCDLPLCWHGVIDREQESDEAAKRASSPAP